MEVFNKRMTLAEKVHYIEVRSLGKEVQVVQFIIITANQRVGS